MTDRLTTLLVDDEPLALDLLDAMLADHPVIELAGRCASGAAALERLADAPVDLVFLDVEMPGLSGIETARAMDPKPMIVFATAHAEFAVDAFAADAVDYVLKPFEQERVLAAVEKAALQRAFRLPGRALTVTRPRETLPVRDGRRTNLVPVREILWAEAAGDYALLHAEGVTHTARVTLRDLEGELEAAGFLRVHRSAIVREAAVSAVSPLPKGEAMLTLADGTQVKASRSYRAAIVRLAAGR